jgi:thioredoxin reductase (NADPH)
MTASTFDTRQAQMFPALEAEQVQRLRRFGRPLTFPAGDVLTRAGEIGVGLFVLLAGRIEISRRDATGQSVPIIEHDPGQFVGEVAQLSGRPSLVNVKALTDVEVLQIAPDRLRAVLIAEAELGEKDHAGPDPSPGQPDRDRRPAAR